MDDSYERATREAYRSVAKATAYDDQLRGFTWMRFAMWREKRAVRLALRACALSRKAKVLDLPCGTGLLADLLAAQAYDVVGADISLEMIQVARPYYAVDRTAGFVNADALALPFRRGAFDCVVSIGFFHRLPPAIRRQALATLGDVSRGKLIASFSLDSVARRVKLALLRALRRNFSSAPAPVRFRDLETELNGAGWRIARRWAVAPLLSSESVFLLERMDGSAR
jgi:SAM-dependent methyltransferase